MKHGPYNGWCRIAGCPVYAYQCDECIPGLAGGSCRS